MDSAKGILGGDVSAEAPLMAAGLDSLGAGELRKALMDRTGLDLPTTVVFDYPTISALSDFISSQTLSMEQQQGRLHVEGAPGTEGALQALAAKPQTSALQTEPHSGQSSSERPASYFPCVLHLVHAWLCGAAIENNHMSCCHRCAGGGNEILVSFKGYPVPDAHTSTYTRVYGTLAARYLTSS